MKRIISTVLAVLLLCSISSPCLAAAGENEAEPYSLDRTTVMFDIDSNGKATAYIRCAGASDVTKIKLVVFFKEKIGNIWERVDLKTANDQIVCTENSGLISREITVQMPDKGKSYKVTVEVTFYGDTTRVETHHSFADYN